MGLLDADQIGNNSGGGGGNDITSDLSNSQSFFHGPGFSSVVFGVAIMFALAFLAFAGVLLGAGVLVLWTVAVIYQRVVKHRSMTAWAESKGAATAAESEKANSPFAGMQKL
jgi:hypothetical protein